jgi:hypothetical protein
VRLPYDASLTEAGIRYATRSLHYTYNRMGLGLALRLRKIVAGVAVEQALQRWLPGRGLAFDVLGQTPYTDSDRYDLRLGGRRCDVKSFWVSDRARISALRHNPACLLEAEALVPADQLRSDRLAGDDLYLFGFLAGLETRSQGELERALAAEQPACLIYALPQAEWRGAGQAQRSLGRLVLKAAGPEPLTVEVGGQAAGTGAAVSETLHLAPRQRVVTQHDYAALLYLRLPGARRLPAGPVGVRSPALRSTVVVEPEAWFNIWVYGFEVFLAGWATKAEMRAHGRPLPAGTRVWQYARTATPNQALSVRDLHDVRELFNE